MKKVALLLIMTLSISGYTSPKSKKESIKELFVLMKQDSLLLKMVESIPFMANTCNQPQGVTDPIYIAQQQRAQKIKLLVISGLFPNIQMDMIDYYDRYFTQKEIDGYIRFYKSPSGQKLLQSTPVIMKNFMGEFNMKYMSDILGNIMIPINKQENKDINKTFPAPDSASIAAMKAEYLDVAIDATAANLTVVQKQVLMKAIERTNRYLAFDEQQGKFVLKVTSAEELNMSERLFAFMKKNVEIGDPLLTPICKRCVVR